MSDYKYRIRYSRRGEQDSNSTIPCVDDVYGVSAMSALNNFHRKLQLTQELNDTKKVVIRAKLGYKDYTITRMSQLFNSDTSGFSRGEWIESDFDIPNKARNPDLSKKQDKVEEEPTLAFMADVGTGRLAE